MDLSYTAFTSAEGTGNGTLAPPQSGATKGDLSYNAFQAAKSAKPVALSTEPFSNGGLPKPANVGFTEPFSAQASTLGKQISDSYSASLQQGVEGINKIFSGQGAIGGLEGGLQVGAGIAGMAFSPLAPLTNLISKAIDYAGQKLSNLPYVQGYGKDVANLPPDTNDTATRQLTALQNLGGIAMGILGAKSGEIKAVDIPPAKLAEVAQHPDVIAAAQKVVATQKPDLSYNSFQKIAPSTHELARTIQTEMPNLQASRAYDIADRAKTQPDPQAFIKSELAQINPKSLPSYPTEIPRATAADTTSKLAANEAPTPALNLPGTSGRTTQTLKSIEGTGELRTRGSALSVEAGAIEKGLTDNLGTLPEYRTINFKEMAPKIAEAFAQHPEAARAIALGDKAAPKGTTPEMFAVTLEKMSLERGDVQTLQALANSKLTAAGTTMGQRIASYAQRDAVSPINAIREVQAAREEALAKRGATIKQETVTRIKEAVRRTNTKQNWGDFISSIQC